MEELCTLEQAKAVLGVFDDSQDSEIAEVITMASAAILNYLQLSDEDAAKIADGGLSGLFNAIQIECLRAGCLRLIPVIYDGTGEKTPDYSQSNGELPRSVTMFIHRLKRNIIA